MMGDLFGEPEASDEPGARGAPAARSGDGAPRPLADRLRPTRLDEVVGQDHLLAPDAPLGRMAAAGRLSSVILWGPPGVGKTTIARLLADTVDLSFQQISAIFSGVAELRKVFEAAKARRAAGRGTLLFVDEIHRFNRAQQDSFLPHMEDGVIVLVGATTENPSFELNAAILSRAQVLTLKPLDEAALMQLVERAEQAMERTLPLTKAARETLIGMADGDGRALLNLVEEALSLPPEPLLEPQELAARLTRRAPLYDKSRDGHYNLISALHKSVRGSDPDASLYWLCRMLEGGEDPLYIARRLARMAVEDIGLAEPQALAQVMAAKDAYDFMGSPEGELALAQATVFLALAPKSNAAYVAYKAAARDARDKGSPNPPAHIMNAPTKLMKEQGYGAGYDYDHDAPDGFSGADYFPEGWARPSYYQPVERGFEREMQKRVAWFAKLRAQRQGGG